MHDAVPNTVPSEIRIKLTAAQLTALETAGVFEEPMDEDEQWLNAAIQDDGHLVTRDPLRLSRIMYNLSSNADDYAEKRGPHLDADSRRMYRRDRDVFSRIARKLLYLERALSLKSEMREWLSHVALWEVKTLEDMRQCRRIVPGLHTGHYRDVAAEEMFAALQELRQEPSWRDREQVCRNQAETLTSSARGLAAHESAAELPAAVTLEEQAQLFTR